MNGTDQWANITQTNFSLGLFGKLYLDTIAYLESFNSGETNSATLVKKNKGGLHNILRANLPFITPYLFYDSEVKAFIISESAYSKRSSILHSIKKYKKPKIDQAPLDWLHVAYIDDLCYPENLNDLKVKFSIDFCTLKSREQYLNFMNKASLIFDSRERKDLYRSIKTKTPLILHDKYGCECIIENQVVNKGFTNPIENIHVNGAGDIYAGIFLYYYHNKGLEYAIESTSKAVTNLILKLNEI